MWELNIPHPFWEGANNGWDHKGSTGEPSNGEQRCLFGLQSDAEHAVIFQERWEQGVELHAQGQSISAIARLL